MAAQRKPKPSLMVFEGPQYSDGSGPQIVVEYDSGGVIITEPHITLDPGGSESFIIYQRNVPWLIETLQRIQKETM